MRHVISALSYLVNYVVVRSLIHSHSDKESGSILQIKHTLDSTLAVGFGAKYLCSTTIQYRRPCILDGFTKTQGQHTRQKPIPIYAI